MRCFWRMALSLSRIRLPHPTLTAEITCSKSNSQVSQKYSRITLTILKIFFRPRIRRYNQSKSVQKKKGEGRSLPPQSYRIIFASSFRTAIWVAVQGFGFGLLPAREGLPRRRAVRCRGLASLTIFSRLSLNIRQTPLGHRGKNFMPPYPLYASLPRFSQKFFQAHNP